MDAKLLFVHAISPLHAGTGQGVGAIDLPIAREKATNLPYLPGSSLKGVLRDACQNNDALKARSTDIFGPDTGNADLHAGSVHFTDQRLLLFPVRSLRGTFAWVTAPFVLRRFTRDANGLANNTAFPGDTPDLPDETCLVTSTSQLIGTDNTVILEDIPLAHQKNADAWADALGKALFLNDGDPWRITFKERFCIVPDEVFGFLVETATEVVARIALEDDTKTVKQGALWYEESLPAESILSGLVVASPVAKTSLDADFIFGAISSIIDKPLQLGGSATVGRGLCRLQM